MRIGILGGGNIARAHVNSYRRTDGCRIVAVAEIDEPRGRALAAEAGAIWYRDWQALLETAEIDAVSVCLPHSMHAEVTIDAARAGLHVLCEKPIATSLADADRMIEACRSAGVTLMIGHTHRFRAEHIRAKELLDGGAIGQVLQVQDVIYAGRDGMTSLGWRGLNALNGGGVFMDNGIHSADRIRWWLGSDAAWVAARLGRGTDIVEGEDHGIAVVAMRNGTTAVLEQSFSVPRAAGVCYASFLGSEGVLRVDTWQGLRIARLGQPWEDVPLSPDAPDGFDAEIREFTLAVKQGREPAVTGHDGRAALEIIQAIYAANERGGSVELPLSRQD